MLKHARCFATARTLQSYIGSTAIPLPKEVSLSTLPLSSASSAPSTSASHAKRSSSSTDSATRTLSVRGPKGEITLPLPSYLTLSQSDPSSTAATNTVSLSILDKRAKVQRSMWGTTRALLNNAITGVTEGFTVSLKFVGVGYRAAVEGGGSTVSLRVGYSKPVVLAVPEGVGAHCPLPTALVLEGRDKQVVTQFAAVIRSYRRPEPYKGKGIFVDNETIKIKSPAGKK